MNAPLRHPLDASFDMSPVSKMTVPEWADTYRHLSPAVSSIGGAWKTSRVEIARGPMMAVTEEGVRTISIKSATQTMKSSILESIIGYHAHLNPGPMLLTQPKEDSARSFSKERLAPMIRATPVLRDIFGDVARDRSGDSLQYKEFPGGFLAIESAGSPTNLAMRAIRITLLDEIDKYEGTKEGDPVLLAEERTATFVNGLHVRTCSPTWEETSRIEKSYNDSDMRRPYVACPHCSHEQTLEFFKHVQWKKSDDGREHFPLTAAIYCESCGAEWSEDQRRKLITTEGAIRWHQTRKFECCGVHQEPIKTRSWDWDAEAQCGYATCTECGKRAVSNEHAGFTASKLFSPFITVPTLAEKWIQSKDDIESRQVFYNTQLGMAFSAQAARKVEVHSLASRREVFPARVPKGVLRLTAGVDTQKDRLEIQVVGWGYPGEEAWSVDYHILPGDPSKPELWNRLEEYLQSTFAYEEGGQMRISATCIDSGGEYTQSVYAFCQPRAKRNIWAIKGSSWSKQGDPVWPVPKSRKTRDWGYKPVVIAVDSAKDAMRQKLLTEEPGPGYFHIPAERSDGWLEQLTAENLILEKKGGFTSRRWRSLPGRANEAWDTLIYAYAALCGLRAVRGLKLERAAAQFENFKAPEVEAPMVAAPPSPPVRHRVRRSNWMQKL